jgi:hypothetical protein
MIAALIAAFMSVAEPAAAAAPASADLQFVDLTGDFDRVWKETSALPEAERAKGFRAAFAPILPGFYDPERVKDFVTAERYDATILKGLNAFPQQRDSILRVSRDFQQMVGPARREFEATFGPMKGYPAIYVVHSFGEFDGGTRDLKSGNHLMFGADVIARIYDDMPIKPFVQHELFHLMHGRSFPDCEKLYCSLWQEGLATYVAASLNPGADDVALGLTIPAPIRPAVEANKPGAICAVRARLDSEKPDDYASLFYGSSKIEGFPARMGYYVGYLVAHDIGRTRDLKQLAAMSPAEARPLIVRSLDAMADCAEVKPERG